MPNFLTVLMNAIKAKITPIWTKLRLWTNWSFIQTRILTKARQFFSKTLSIRPRHKNDYYPILLWLVSKKLAFAIVLVIGVVSLFYLCFVQPISVFRESGDGVKTYSYDSFPLRFTTGIVRIKSKSGYLAYEGNVEKGKAVGAGILYDSEGNMIYSGNFENSAYHAQGRLYYPGGQLKYSGAFENNLYEGSGVLYRSNGSKEYEGTFGLGLKEGKGTLYDGGGNAVYSGNFSRNQILYTDFLGKTTEEIADSYKGSRTVYTDHDYFAVSLNDIGAIYCGSSNEEWLNNSMMVEGLYVLSDTIVIDGVACKNVAELNQVFGMQAYEGNSEVTVPEAVAIDRLIKSGNKDFPSINLITNSVFADVLQVESYEPDYYIYLYTYTVEDLVYTFFFRERTGGFAMYLIEKEGL